MYGTWQPPETRLGECQGLRLCSARRHPRREKHIDFRIVRGRFTISSVWMCFDSDTGFLVGQSRAYEVIHLCFGTAQYLQLASAGAEIASPSA